MYLTLWQTNVVTHTPPEPLHNAIFVTHAVNPNCREILKYRHWVMCNNAHIWSSKPRRTQKRTLRDAVKQELRGAHVKTL